MPGPHVDTTVAVRDQGRKTVFQRLVLHSVDRRSVVAVTKDEAAVEGGEQPPALAVRNLHRAADRCVRRLVAARVKGDRSSCVVEPGDVRDDSRIVHLCPERREEDRRASADERAGAFPDPLARQHVREDRLDPSRVHRRPVLSRRLRRRRTGDADRRQRLELRAALLRCLPRVVVVLDLVDEPVAVVRPQPLDAAWPERQARRLQHRRRVGVDHRHEKHEDGQRDDSANMLSPPLQLAAAGEAGRLLDGAGRFQSWNARPHPVIAT